MAKNLLIESRDPFDSSDSEYFYEMVEGISNRENEVTPFLVQNGVFPCEADRTRNRRSRTSTGAQREFDWKRSVLATRHEDA